jgi:hypothetical protein
MLCRTVGWLPRLVNYGEGVEKGVPERKRALRRSTFSDEEDCDVKYRVNGKCKTLMVTVGSR